MTEERVYIDRFLKEICASILQNGTPKISLDLQSALNIYLTQPKDYENTVLYTKDGLALFTQTEVIEYVHHRNLSMRLIVRKH